MKSGESPDNPERHSLFQVVFIVRACGIGHFGLPARGAGHLRLQMQEPQVAQQRTNAAQAAHDADVAKLQG